VTAELAGRSDSAGAELLQFRTEACQFLEAHAEPKRKATGKREYGVGSESVEVFPALDEEREKERIGKVSEWYRTRFDAGFGAITWPSDYGGRGLPSVYARLYRAEESRFNTPPPTELFAVTVDLIAPTILAHGSDEQRRKFISPLLRTDVLACQLFSEPGAGSDLASLSCRAETCGATWLLNGQKVWTSGARHAGLGLAICRTDPLAEKHIGMTAFLIPMDKPGVDVRPIRQMTGGSSFNEVFLTNVEIPDSHRLGALGQGWNVAKTTLRLERASAHVTSPGGSFGRLRDLAQHLNRTGDAVIRQELARVFIGGQVIRYTDERVRAQLKSHQTPGPEGSIRKLLWVQNLNRIGQVAAAVLGPRITADTSEWGTYAWAAHLLGAPGYRIAGGSDEIQRNIIAERVLGLPSDPSA
jgi:alkylation response protein AidB-like acyl-CoA dehydrogenase